MNLWLPVNCNDEYASKPAWVRVEVDAALVERISDLYAIVVGKQFTEIAIDPPTPQRWQGDRDYTPEGEDGFKLRGERMTVTKWGTVYWSCYEDYAGDDFDTTSIPLDTLAALLASGAPDAYYEIEKDDIEEAQA